MSEAIPFKKGDMLFAHAALNLAPGLSLKARRVGGALLEHFNTKTGRCDPGIKRLQTLLGMSRTAVVEAIKELCMKKGEDPDDEEKEGFFTKRTHGGRHNTNFYLPRWDRFRTVVADFKSQMSGPTDEEDTEQLCRKPGTGCAGNPALDVPETRQQTLLKNPPKEPSLTTEQVETRVSEKAAPSRRNRPKGSRKERVQKDQTFLLHAIPGGKTVSRGEVALIEAETRLNRAITADPLRELLQMLVMEDERLYASALEAEKRKPGCGLQYVHGAFRNRNTEIKQWA
ncbi:hypothetical protein ACSSV1_000198 [Labrenzia sp. MBR-25]